jgi:hypothetical protein
MDASDEQRLREIQREYLDFLDDEVFFFSVNSFYKDFEIKILLNLSKTKDFTAPKSET